MSVDKGTWRLVKLGDVARSVKDTVNIENCGLEYYLGGEHFNTDDLHVNGRGIIEGSTIGPAFTMRFQPGHVLLVSRNPHLRKMAVADFTGVCSNVTYVCETKSDSLLQVFLPFIMRSSDFWNFAEANKRGSTNFYLNWSDFARYEFLLPPLNEQKRIAEVLWAADDVIVTQETVYRQLATLRNVFFSETQTENYFLSNKLDYSIMQIDEAYNIFNNFRKPISAADRALIQGDYPYYGPTGILDYINEYKLDGEYALIGEDGDHFLKYSFWDMTQFVKGKFNVNNHAHVVQGKGGNLTKWFYYFFKHRDIVPILSKQGSGRLKLNKATLQTIKMIVPNHKSQAILCSKYDLVEATIQKSSEQLSSSRLLLQQLLRHYLGGAN